MTSSIEPSTLRIQMAALPGYAFVPASPSPPLHRYPPLLPRLTSGVNVKPVHKSLAVVPHTAEQWNVHRGLITRLYREQDLPLREVVQIMESKYNFKAT